MTSKRLAKKETEQPSGPMFIADSALSIWEQTSTANSRNKKVTELFKQLCSQNQERKFNEIWKKLDELTKKALQEIAKKPVNLEPGKEPISLEDVGLDAPNVRRRRGRAVKTLSQWIENEPKEKWCLLHK
jgi:hypothetical protein